MLVSQIQPDGTSIPEYQLFGKKPGKIGAADRFGAPVNSYETKDGKQIQIAAGGAMHFPRFLDAIKMPHLILIFELFEMFFFFVVLKFVN